MVPATFIGVCVHPIVATPPAASILQQPTGELSRRQSPTPPRPFLPSTPLAPSKCLAPKPGSSESPSAHPLVPRTSSFVLIQCTSSLVLRTFRAFPPRKRFRPIRHSSFVIHVALSQHDLIR